MADKLGQGSSAASRARPSLLKLLMLICESPTLKFQPAARSAWAVRSASARVRGWRASVPPTTPMLQGLKALSTLTNAWAVLKSTWGAQASTRTEKAESSISHRLSGPAHSQFSSSPAAPDSRGGRAAGWRATPRTRYQTGYPSGGAEPWQTG